MARPLDTHSRFQLARRENEEWVVARGAMAGERIIAVGRLVLLASIFLGQLLLLAAGGTPLPPDALRAAMPLGWAAFAIVVLVLVKRTPAHRLLKLRRVLLVASPLVDFGFAVAMNARLYAISGESGAVRLALFLAVLLATSVLRSSRAHVAFATVTAALSFAGYAFFTHGAPGGLLVRDSVFVTFALVGEGAFLFFTSTLWRTMLVDFGKIENLSRFLPRRVAKRIREEGEASLAPGTREVTVLFSDIRDFTRTSEKLPPEAVMAFLTDYFERMSAVVNGHDGVVNKFIGDGLLAVWGAPDADPSHAKNAIAAALDMRRVVADLNEDRLRRGEAPLLIGIGIHSGTVAAGMLGGEAQHEYTVIGDAVNTASRIEGLTKLLGEDILVSEQSFSHSKGRFTGRSLGAHPVKGREGTVSLWAVDAVATQLA